jgi:hypothetical protein
MTTMPTIDSGVSRLSATAARLPVPPIQLPARAPNPDQESGGRAPLKKKKATTQPMTMPTEPIVMTAAPRHATRIVSRMLMSNSMRTMNIGTAKDRKVV